MSKKIIFFILIAFAIATVFDCITNRSHSNGGGAPAGKTGSPGDGGATCTGCHAGTVSSQTGWITSNVDTAGYFPDSVYTITAKAIQSGISKFGFEISPQNNLGTLMGTLILGSKMQFTGSGSKYITHTGNGTSGTDSILWTFNWKAPASGSGNVTFYSTFNATNSNFNTSGDKIYKSSLVIKEAVVDSNPNPSGIVETTNQKPDFQIYPNPFSENAEIRIRQGTDKFQNEEFGMQNLELKMYDMQGRIVRKITNLSSQTQIERGNLQAGIYFYQVKNKKEIIANGKLVVTD